MKRNSALILITALFTSILVTTEASSATRITTGVSCASKDKNKSRTVTYKGEKETYKCTTNPISKGSAAKKLVGVNSLCLEANKLIIDTKKEIADLKATPGAPAADITNAEVLNSALADLLPMSCKKGLQFHPYLLLVALK